MRFKFAFLFLTAFLVGILTVIVYGLITKNPNKPVKDEISSIIQTVTKHPFSVEEAPSESIRGTITQMSGVVQLESRVATQSSIISSPKEIQQGEEIQTQVNGNVNIEFPNMASLKVSPQTQIDFIQTLPANFVVSLASGSAEFTKLSNIPVTVRAMHLLIKQNVGVLAVGVDQTNGLVNLTIILGSATVAFNDTSLNSHVLDFHSGQKVIFNDLTRQFSI